MTDSSEKPRRIVGVLGGMGPDATVDFMSTVIAMTPARTDQDHVHMLVDNNPHVPDRQAALQGDQGPVRAELTRMARSLEDAGAEFLVMPCNTAHAFVDDAIRAVSIPFLHIIDETVDEIAARHPEAKRVGLLATNACLASGLYQRALESVGMQAELPGAEDQQECLDLILRIKSGDTGSDVRARMAGLANRVVAAGADVVVAACTEIPLVLDAGAINAPLVSSTAVLARRTVDIATGAADLPAA